MKSHYFAILAIFAFQGTAFPQTAAQIIGTVTNAAGKPAQGVNVQITSGKQHIQSQVATDENGAFVFPAVEPDTYELLASHSEFSDYTTSIQVGAGQTRDVKIQLNSIEESTRITIDERGTTLDLSSPRTGINVTGRELSSMPLNGRTYAPLALTAAGANNSSNGVLDQLHFNGQSTTQNHITYDGIDFSGVLNAATGWLNVSGTRFRLQNSVETLEEFRADSALYSADAGFGTGGQLAAVSRSGSSQWHGSIFEYFRNNHFLTARNYFDNGAKPSQLRMNQFGANFGGSPIKDRLFVSGAFEGLRQATGLDIFEQVPGAAARAAAPEALHSILATLPLPNNIVAGQEFGTATRHGMSYLDETTVLGRVDYLLSPTQRLFARYFHEAGALSTPDISVSTRNISGGTKPDNFVLAWSGALRNKFLNELKVGLNRQPAQVSSSSADPTYANVLLDEKGSSSTSGIIGGPAVPGGIARQFGDGYQRSLDVRGKSYSLTENGSWQWRSHSFKVGGEVRAVRLPYRSLGSTIYMYEDWASILVNRLLYAVRTPDLDFHVGEREYYGVYMMDEWRPTRNLTISLGLRYDYVTPNREKDNRAQVFDVNTFTYLDPKKGFPGTEKKAFQPRVGLSWAPQSLKGKTVVRLGGGIYNGPGQYADVMGPILSDAKPISTTGIFFPYPVDFAGGVPTPTGIDASGYRSSERNIQYGASIQQELPFRVVLTTGYTGSISRNLLQRDLTNLLVANSPTGPVRVHPEYGEIDYYTGGGKDYYNGLQVAATRRFVDGLTLGLQYTWAHGIGDAFGSTGDTPQNALCLACERADNDFDVRQVFSTNAVLDLPFGRSGNGLRSRLVKNWSIGAAINSRTGLPVNVKSLFSVAGAPPGVVAPPSPAGFLTVFRPNYNGLNPYRKNGTGWLNQDAFTFTPPGTAGNLGRNALRGPGFWQSDLMLARVTKVSERVNLEFRAEAFNVFNHTNFGQPYATLAADDGSSNIAIGFGTMNSTVGQNVGLGTSRQVQAGLRISF